MNQSDISGIIKGIAPVIRDYVAKAFESMSGRVGDITTRLDDFDGRLKAIPTEALKGEPGKDADPNEVAKIVVNELSPDKLFSSKEFTEILARIQEQAGVNAELAAIPAGPKGDPGIPGKDADPDLVAALVAENVSAVAEKFCSGLLKDSSSATS